MFGFTIVLVVLTVFFITLWIIGIVEEWELGILNFAFSFITGLILFVQVSEIVNAYKEAEFYNKHFKTNYTPEEVFWNSDTIKEQIIGDKKNLNIKMEKGE